MGDCRTTLTDTHVEVILCMRISKKDHKSFSFLCEGTILHIMDLSAILIDLIDLNSLNNEVLPQK